MRKVRWNVKLRPVDLKYMVYPSEYLVQDCIDERVLQLLLKCPVCTEYAAAHKCPLRLVRHQSPALKYAYLKSMSEGQKIELLEHHDACFACSSSAVKRG